MSDNFTSKNACIKAATLKVKKILKKNKLVALYATLLEHAKYQWFLYRSFKFSEVGSRRKGRTQKVL
jgi:hypothetical protein